MFSIPSPYVLLAKVGVCVAIVGGAYLYGHHNGYTGEKLVYDKYVSDQAAKAEAQVAANKSALLFQQTQFNLDQTRVQKDHSDEITKLTATRDAAVADSQRAVNGLRAYLASAGRRAVVVHEAATGTTGANQEGSGGLSDGVSSLNWYLTQRFYTADVNAATLNEAIDLIAQDRQYCNGSLPGVNPQ